MNKNTFQPFYEQLMQFVAMSKQQIFKIATEYDLTSTQAFILLLTHQEEPRTMNSYCNMLACDASNITGIVDGLERKQLIARTEHPTDRRIKTIKLLPKGSEVRQAIFDRLSDRNSSYILSRLNEDEVTQFTQLIQKITS